MHPYLVAVASFLVFVGLLLWLVWTRVGRRVGTAMLFIAFGVALVFLTLAVSPSSILRPVAVVQYPINYSYESTVTTVVTETSSNQIVERTVTYVTTKTVTGTMITTLYTVAREARYYLMIPAMISLVSVCVGFYLMMEYLMGKIGRLGGGR